MLLTWPKNENKSPSLAIEYKQRGNANNDPNSVVVIPQSAPIDIAYLAQSKFSEPKASGRAADGLIWSIGTIRVKVADTKMYPIVTIDKETTVAIGIDFEGFLASSPATAIESNPTKA